MAIEQISKERVSELSVSGLSTRPNMGGRLGRTGLTSRQLREAFDRLPLAAIEKINEMIELINRLGIGSEQSIPELVESLLQSHDHDDRYPLKDEVGEGLAGGLSPTPDGENPLIAENGMISPVYLPEVLASAIAISDDGSYFEGADLESILSEIGEMLDGLDMALSEI